MKNPLAKFAIKKDKKSNIFHTTAHGRAQSGNNFGTASAQGFDTRLQIDSSRKHVAGYSDSSIAVSAKSHRPSAKITTASAPESSSPVVRNSNRQPGATSRSHTGGTSGGNPLIRNSNRQPGGANNPTFANNRTAATNRAMAASKAHTMGISRPSK